jgi:hypothetical protein
MTVLQAQIASEGEWKHKEDFAGNVRQDICRRRWSRSSMADAQRLQAELHSLLAGSGGGKKLQGAAPAPGRGTRRVQGTKRTAVPNGASFNELHEVVERPTVKSCRQLWGRRGLRPKRSYERCFRLFPEPGG